MVPIFLGNPVGRRTQTLL